MDAIITGVAVGVIMAGVNTALGAILSARNKERKETQQMCENTRRV